MELNELERSKTQSRKSLIVIEALMRGHEVLINKNKYVMGKTDNNGYKVCMVAKSEDKEIILGSEMPIGNFITMCEEMKEEETALAVSGLVLEKSKVTMN